MYLFYLNTFCVKGGLTLESFSLWIKLPKKRFQITLPIISSLGHSGYWFGTFFWDLRQSKKKKLHEIKPPLKWDQCVKSYTKLILDVVSWCWFACRQDVWGENLATGHDVTSFRMVLDSKGRAGGQQPDLPDSPTARPPGQPAVGFRQPEGSDGLLGKPRNFLIWPNP